MNCLQGQSIGTICLFAGARTADPRWLNVKRLGANRALEQHFLQQLVSFLPSRNGSSSSTSLFFFFFYKAELKCCERAERSLSPQGALGQRWCISRLLALLFRVRCQVGSQTPKRVRDEIKHTKDSWKGHTAEMISGPFYRLVTDAGTEALHRGLCAVRCSVISERPSGFYHFAVSLIVLPIHTRLFMTSVNY